MAFQKLMRNISQLMKMITYYFQFQFIKLKNEVLIVMMRIMIYKDLVKINIVKILINMNALTTVIIIMILFLKNVITMIILKIILMMTIVLMIILQDAILSVKQDLKFGSNNYHEFEMAGTISHYHQYFCLRK